MLIPATPSQKMFFSEAKQTYLGLLSTGLTDIICGTRPAKQKAQHFLFKAGIPHKYWTLCVNLNVLQSIGRKDRAVLKLK